MTDNNILPYPPEKSRYPLTQPQAQQLLGQLTAPYDSLHNYLYAYYRDGELNFDSVSGIEFVLANEYFRPALLFWGKGMEN